MNIDAASEPELRRFMDRNGMTDISFREDGGALVGSMLFRGRRFEWGRVGTVDRLTVLRVLAREAVLPPQPFGATK